MVDKFKTQAHVEVGQAGRERGAGGGGWYEYSTFVDGRTVTVHPKSNWHCVTHGTWDV